MDVRQLTIEVLAQPGFERVVQASAQIVLYRGFVALHSSKLGPAVGGVRMRTYTNGGEALADALRLAEAMSYKCALAGLPFGGGKSVIMAVPADRNALLRAHAATIDSLNGQYIGAGDVGVSPVDLEYMRGFTPHLARGKSAASSTPVTSLRLAWWLRCAAWRACCGRAKS